MNFEITQVWLEFLAVGTLIAVAGSFLARYGDIISEKTGMGGTWIGLILLATVTSLPELITGVSSVRIANVPDVAIGDALGSCIFNLFILVILDFQYRHESLYLRASHGHILSAGFGVILLGVVTIHMSLSAIGIVLSWGHVGLYVPVIIVFYAVAMRTVFRYEKRSLQATVEDSELQYPHISLSQALLRYFAAAAIVVAAGIWLPFSAEKLANVMGWEQSFVGTLFVAAATSMPEAAVTLAAVRIGALDMAISNLLGSNLFNVLIVAIDDLLYSPGPILYSTSPLHGVTALSAIIMSGVAIVALLYRPATRLFRTIGWASMLMLSLYLLNLFFLYLYQNNNAH